MTNIRSRIEMDENNGKMLAERISSVLSYLKNKKVTQYEIERKLNFTSLSKAKNFRRYPQPVIEKKTRAELLQDLLDLYGLKYNEKLDLVEETGAEIPASAGPETIYYIMYYYAFARETIDKAIVRIVDKRKVYIDYRLDEHWEGTYEVIENYTFMNVIKLGDTTPVKKMVSLFSGTMKYGRPILLGTYSTVKRDGYPAAGTIVMEKKDEASIEKSIKSEPDPRITHYLANKVMVTETFTPNSLDNLSQSYSSVKAYSGEYLFFYPKNNELIQAELSMKKDSLCSLIINDIKYSGQFTLLDVHTIRIELNDTASDFAHTAKESLTIYINTKNLSLSPFYLARCLSNAFEATPSLFRCLIILKDMYQKENHSKILNEFNCEVI